MSRSTRGGHRCRARRRRGNKVNPKDIAIPNKYVRSPTRVGTAQKRSEVEVFDLKTNETFDNEFIPEGDNVRVVEEAKVNEDKAMKAYGTSALTEVGIDAIDEKAVTEEPVVALGLEEVHTEEHPDEPHEAETSEMLNTAIVPRYPEKDKATTEVKTEPEVENFSDVPTGVEVEDSTQTQVEVKKEPENENFFDITPVKVEHGQDFEVEDYSTWTQENYLLFGLL